MPTVLHSNEVALFRAVIGQALSDATLGNLHTTPHTRRLRTLPNAERLRELSQARAWFEGKGADFRMVCEHALLDPNAVADKAKAEIQRFDAAFPHVWRLCQKGRATQVNDDCCDSEEMMLDTESNRDKSRNPRPQGALLNTPWVDFESLSASKKPNATQLSH